MIRSEQPSTAGRQVQPICSSQLTSSCSGSGMPAAAATAAWGWLERQPGAWGVEPRVLLPAGKSAFKVGRGKDCDLRLDGAFFSVLHCTIRKSSSAAAGSTAAAAMAVGSTVSYTLENSSANGTWVDSAQLAAKGQCVKLTDGALISLVVPASDAVKKFKEEAVSICSSPIARPEPSSSSPPPSEAAAAAASTSQRRAGGGRRRRRRACVRVARWSTGSSVSQRGRRQRSPPAAAPP